MSKDIGFNAVAFADAVRREVATMPGAKPERMQTMMLCPFHSERTPSGKINHDPASPYLGRYFCWGCSARFSWKDFSSKVGLAPLNGKEFHSENVPHFMTEFYQEELLGVKAKEVVDKKEDRERPFTAENFEEIVGDKWRGFGFDFLSKIDNIRFRKRFRKLEEGGWEDFWCVRLPVVVNGIERGHSDALLEKPEKGSSYLNMKGDWTHSYGLFPFDYAVRLMRRKNIHTMVLVEGQRDALRLLRTGIPAVAIMGTKSWSVMKIRLLELAGVNRIILCMDGDGPGEEASELLEPTLTEGFDLHVVKLWVVAKKLNRKKIDPGNMPVRELRQLKNLALKV